MRKVWRKLAAAGLAAAMTASALTGCGSKESAPAGGETQAEAAGEPVEVTFWHVYSENFGAPVIKEMVE